MSMHSFLNFNKRCPVCNNTLSLYWQWIPSMLFKAIEVEPHVYYFAKYLLRAHDFSTEDDRSMTLVDYDNGFKTSFSCPSLLSDVKPKETYFYFLCNEGGFDTKNINEINLARGCYYRSTSIMEFQKEDSSWNLKCVIPEFAGLPYKDEAFCLRKRKFGEDKVYMLNRDLESQTTKVFYFTITDEQRKIKDFKPNVFRNELPLIERPSFKDKDKIISKIETYILMS